MNLAQLNSKGIKINKITGSNYSRNKNKKLTARSPESSGGTGKQRSITNQVKDHITTATKIEY